jgi:hypothetical protein
MRIRWKRSAAVTLLAFCGPAWAASESAPTTRPQADRLPPVLVTLHVKDAPVRRAYAELFQQVGLTVESMPDGLLARDMDTVTEDADRRPFWDVVRDLQQQTGLEFAHGGNDAVIVKGARTPLHGPRCIDGPLLFVATGFTYDVNLDPDPQRGTGSQLLQLKLQQLDGPGLDILQQSSDVKVVEAVDELGNSLAPIKPQRVIENLTGVAGGWGLTALLHVPDKKIGVRLARFRGTVRMLVETFDKPMEIMNLPAAPAHAVTLGNNTFTFLSCKKAGTQYSITLEVKQEKMVNPHAGPLLRTHARAYDAAGHELAYTLGSTLAEGTGRLRSVVTVLIAPGEAAEGGKAGPPAKLIWQIPSGTKDIDVPMEFHDLKMDLFGGP